MSLWGVALCLLLLCCAAVPLPSMCRSSCCSSSPPCSVTHAQRISTEYRDMVVSQPHVCFMLQVTHPRAVLRHAAGMIHTQSLCAHFACCTCAYDLVPADMTTSHPTCTCGHMKSHTHAASVVCLTAMTAACNWCQQISLHCCGSTIRSSPHHRALHDAPWLPRKFPLGRKHQQEDQSSVLQQQACY